MVQEIREDNEAIEPLADRIIGRYTAEPVIHPETGEVIIGENQLITPETGRQIIDAGIEECHIRSVLTCREEHGVCARCYGSNLATGGAVNIGEQWESLQPSHR